VTFKIIFYSKPFLSSIEASPNMAPKSSQKSIVEMNVDRGSKVHLPCNIQGNPLPIYTWYRLSDSGSYYSVPSSQRVIPSQTLLLIRNVDDRDAGRWVITHLFLIMITSERFSPYFFLSSSQNRSAKHQTNMVNSSLKFN
jgi:hypothetical protein